MAEYQQKEQTLQVIVYETWTTIAVVFLPVSQQLVVHWVCRLKDLVLWVD